MGCLFVYFHSFGPDFGKEKDCVDDIDGAVVRVTQKNSKIISFYFPTLTPTNEEAFNRRRCKSTNNGR